MCPWPEAATLGIQKPRGLLLAESKSIPLCVRLGVAVRLPISYQRDPLRPPPPCELGVPLELTRILCAVQRLVAPVSLFFLSWAANNRVSSASRFLFWVFPW